MKELQPAAQKNLVMHPREPPYSLNTAATQAMGVLDSVDVLDAVATGDTVEAVEPEIAMKVNAPITKMTPIWQMHAESA